MLQFTTISLSIKSFEYCKFSDAVTLFNIHPLFTSLMSPIFLKSEPLNKKILLGALISFLGVLFISKPEFLFGN